MENRGLSAIAQCESLRFKLLSGLPARRACYGVIRYVMESGARGCEVVVSGKLRGQRAKSMKFVDGLMIHSGQPVNDFVDYAVQTRSIASRCSRSQSQDHARLGSTRHHRSQTSPS